VSTKYNVLYNGNLAFESGKNGLIESFNDDYWQILPVERMRVSEEIFLPGANKNTDFERAEEKAVKAIQKHGMNIRGKEKNPQTDEAYLLLGKARYFDQRFVPALEAFNYILYKHPTSDKINHAKIWREKVNIRLENTQLAIANLKRLIEEEEDLSDQDVSDANAMLAQAYINNKHLDSAIAPIKTAVSHTKNKEIRGRLGYIKGQLYNKLGYKDSANIAFDEIIKLKRKTLWVYYVNAQVAKSRNFDFENGDKLAYSEYLTKLSEDREYKPYLDKIYNLMAVYHQNVTSDSLAIKHFNKSIKSATSDDYLQSLNYRALAEYEFDATNYKNAGAYYDSTMTKLKAKSKEFRLFKKKRDNLEDVITYEDLAKRNDSILRILNYTEDERLAYFTKHITNLKTQDSLKKVKETEKLLSSTVSNEAQSNGKGKQSKGSVFYFYNPTTVAYGKVEFRKIWGDRVLEDDWRRSDKGIAISETDSDVSEVDSISKEKEIDDIYTTEYYLSQLPVSPKQKDSVIGKRNFAYYQLGLIYKQKFKEYELASKRLEKLISFNPDERLALPAKYQLYKIYTELKSGKKESVKQDIISNYPTSRYAEILRNPDAALSFAEGSPKAIYERLYRKFENQEYEFVAQELEKHIIQFDGDEMLPKFELLKAVVLGKMDGFESYRKQVSYVALNYPNSEEGKSAQQMLSTTIAALSKQKLNDNSAGKNYKLIYVFDNASEAIQQTKEGLEKALKDTRKEYLKVSLDYYNKEKAFVVVHGFITQEVAANFNSFLDENKKKYKPGKVFVTPSSDNYKVIQIHKKLTEFQNTKTPK
jgi:tetratricopeptide (TPR) repeat protein